MRDYVDSLLLPALHAAGLDSFDALWHLDAEWFEPPNNCRGGWSGVARIEVADGNGVVHGLFLKRQLDHTRPSILHPVHGEATFRAEMRNILGAAKAGVPTPVPVFFAERHIDGKACVVLMTRELVGLRPVDAWVDEWKAGGWRQSKAQRRRLLVSVAAVIRRLHRAGFVHNALHPKHVFARIDPQGEVDVCLIDLEKMRRQRVPFRTALRDLDSLNRRSRHWSASDRLRFLKLYLGTGRLGWRGRLLWRLLARRYAARLARERGDAA